MAFAEYAIPGERGRWIRRLVGPLVANSLLSGKNYPPGDLLVETEAEMSFDSQRVLSRIEVPVMLLCGDRDRFFPQDVVDATVRLIPNCTLVRYAGHGHMKVATSRRVAHEVLAFVNRNCGGGRREPQVWKPAEDGDEPSPTSTATPSTTSPPTSSA
jgi:pimeloyl-ACP methyl ester carboxylesterase